MRRTLSSLDVEIMGLNDLNTKIPEVDESGSNPLENARIKALVYYKEFRMPVFSCDSGLFFKGLHDELQPGVHVRTINGVYLSDSELTEYYSKLTKEHGDITARYKNAICLVIDDNTVYDSMEDNLSGDSFIITSIPHKKRVKGFPLDCLSLHIPTGKYYYDLEKYDVDSAMENGFIEFFNMVLSNNETLI
jgi:8-oxo-dGTP diphosphatase